MQALGLDEAGRAEFQAEAAEMTQRLFLLEDPSKVNAVGLELRMETELAGTRLRGIIDRLELTADGELVVTDYKTGRPPSERYEQSKRGLERRVGAIWSAVERACEHEDFRPKPGPLCNWCAFAKYCPTQGGDPAQAVVELGVKPPRAA